MLEGKSDQTLQSIFKTIVINAHLLEKHFVFTYNHSAIFISTNLIFFSVLLVFLSIKYRFFIKYISMTNTNYQFLNIFLLIFNGIILKNKYMK